MNLQSFGGFIRKFGAFWLWLFASEKLDWTETSGMPTVRKHSVFSQLFHSEPLDSIEKSVDSKHQRISLYQLIFQSEVLDELPPVQTKRSSIWNLLRSTETLDDDSTQSKYIDKKEH